MRSQHVKFEIVLNRGNIEIPVQVEGKYSAGRPAVFYTRDGSGQPEEPAEFDIESAVDVMGREIDLSEDELEKITDLAAEKSQPKEPVEWDGCD